MRLLRYLSKTPPSSGGHSKPRAKDKGSRTFRPRHRPLVKWLLGLTTLVLFSVLWRGIVSNNIDEICIGGSLAISLLILLTINLITKSLGD